MLVLATQSAHAKCAPDFRVFSGVVTDRHGNPVPGAMVGVSWLENAGPAGPALAMTDTKGRYTISVLFDTYSGKGKVTEDECEQRLQVISLSAFKGSLRSPGQSVRIGDAEKVALPPAMIWVDAEAPTALRFLKTPGR
jgi:hypothetical protein